MCVYNAGAYDCTRAATTRMTWLANTKSNVKNCGNRRGLKSFSNWANLPVYGWWIGVCNLNYHNHPVFTKQFNEQELTVLFDTICRFPCEFPYGSLAMRYAETSPLPAAKNLSVGEYTILSDQRGVPYDANCLWPNGKYGKWRRKLNPMQFRMQTHQEQRMFFKSFFLHYNLLNNRFSMTLM